MELSLSCLDRQALLYHSQTLDEYEAGSCDCLCGRNLDSLSLGKRPSQVEPQGITYGKRSDIRSGKVAYLRSAELNLIQVGVIQAGLAEFMTSQLIVGQLRLG